jgi:predicted nucleotidyltransferase
MQAMPTPILEAISFLRQTLGGQAELYLFGSRARGAARSGSDYDVAIRSRAPLSWQEFAVMKTRAEDIAWPWSIDVVDLHRIPEQFRRFVETDGILLDELSYGAPAQS